MIKYYCKICEQYIDENMRDKNENKCLICKSRLEKARDKLKNYKEIKYNEKYAIEKYNFENNYITIESKIYWCKTHNIPLYEKECKLCKQEKLDENIKYVSTDVRPVFPEERLLLSVLIDDMTEDELLNSSVWYGANKYIINGQSLELTKGELMKEDLPLVIKKFNEKVVKYSNSQDRLYQYFNKTIENFTIANEERLAEIDTIALQEISEIADDFDDDELFVSFSGGKDSTVVHDLVIRELSGKTIRRIFGDTTLEFKETYEYVERVKENTKRLPFLKAVNKDDDFYELSKHTALGPPSRVMRWCCTFFKTGPLTKRMDRAFRRKGKILAFQGIRRTESISRSKYKMISNESKIKKQTYMSPIIDWLDFDIWLYILSRRIDFNDAYRKGYSRVGCWLCPNNNKWDIYLSKVYCPELSEKWESILLDFAKATNKINPEDYVNDGSWKARQGGNGLILSENNTVEFEPCAQQEDTFNYELTRPISNQLYEFFKPFGYIDENSGNSRLGEVYVVSKNKIPLIRLQGREGNKQLKVTILSLELGGVSKKIRNLQDAKNKIECQLTKYQMCIGCLGCTSLCKYGAIKINKNEDESENFTNDKSLEKVLETQYHIDSYKCLRCGECINYYDSGCYLKKVLRTKRGE